MTPYRYCVKHRLVEGRWWWCEGYYDDKGTFWTVGYCQTLGAARRRAAKYNRRVPQGQLL